MNLEEIISAAVEKRVAEIVSSAIERRPTDDPFTPTDIEAAVQSMVQKIALEEVRKHDVEVRSAIQKVLTDLPTTLKISAYTEIKYPKEQL
jgi:hypothetical protein